MLNSGSFHKTRLAPTPSGYLHLGNVFSFSLVALLAESANASIHLRIDDLDHLRVNNQYLEDIFDTLKFLELPWHTGPFNTAELNQYHSQRHRVPLYENALATLIEKGLIYGCNCSRTQIMTTGSRVYPGTCRYKNIPLATPDIAWRLNTENTPPITVRTLEGEKKIYTLPADMHDVILRKKDGYPSYQLASLIDDVFFEIDLIVRGEDLWPSTLLQLHLAKVLKKDSFLNATFFHHTLLMNNQGTKLSKSAGNTSIRRLRQAGLTAQELYSQIGSQLQLKTRIRNWRDFTGYFL